MTNTILFVCRHDDARSQMEETFLDQLGGSRFLVESAGLNPKTILPTSAAVMGEIGLDIPNRPTRTVDALYRIGQAYDDLITVCDAPSAGNGPVFDYPRQHLHRAFDEPSQFKGVPDKILEKNRPVRDQIRGKILQWLATYHY